MYRIDNLCEMKNAARELLDSKPEQKYSHISLT